MPPLELLRSAGWEGASSALPWGPRGGYAAGGGLLDAPSLCMTFLWVPASQPPPCTGPAAKWEACIWWGSLSHPSWGPAAKWEACSWWGSLSQPSWVRPAATGQLCTWSGASNLPAVSAQNISGYSPPILANGAFFPPPPHPALSPPPPLKRASSSHMFFSQTKPAELIQQMPSGTERLWPWLSELGSGRCGN